MSVELDAFEPDPLLGDARSGPAVAYSPRSAPAAACEQRPRKADHSMAGRFTTLTTLFL